MDDFGIDRPELTGTLISLEFGPGGRIQQLWSGDPNFPDEHEEFQFIAPPLNMGEEITEDYFPGTILLGARTHPDDPWIVSRNTSASPLDDEDETTSGVGFVYDFAFLDEIGATGNFYEIPGPVPQIVWDVTLTNKSRRSVEIGELGFPLAFNNVYEGFSRDDQGIREMYHDRVYVHKYIGGAASYIFAERLNGHAPGLLVYPGNDTRWEFYNHVPASLNTPYRWEGIPVVYAHSQGVIEREGWQEWFSGHTSVVLEPGESRHYQMRFASSEPERPDNLNAVLSACGKPTFKLFPGAVAPASVGIGVEVHGATPARFWTDIEAELEMDSDEEGGFCFLKPPTTGSVKVMMADTQDRESEAHLLFIEPIADLIQARAEYIEKNQVTDQAGALNHAIAPVDNSTGQPMVDPETYGTPFGVEASLGDALFLAEKNTIYPVKSQIKLLDSYLTNFVEDDLQNPLNGAVGSILPSAGSVAISSGRPHTYGLVACLYHSMADVAATYGGTDRSRKGYLLQAAKTIEAMFKHVKMPLMGIPLLSYMSDILEAVEAEGLKEEAARLRRLIETRHVLFGRSKYPFAGDSIWSTEGFEEAFSAAVARGDEAAQERILRCANASKSLAPSWWWYGSDKRWREDESFGQVLADKGELCLGPTMVASAAMFLRTLDRDVASLPESTLRLAFGGMLGVWALVRGDGAAGMGFCPDAASRQFGMSWTTGDVGVGLYHYLRNTGAYVLPTRTPSGLTTFGCHFEIETISGVERYVIRPWDGVGRKVVMRQIGLEVLTNACRIVEVTLDSRKRNATVTLDNSSDKELVATVTVRGMWGTRFGVSGKELQGENEELRLQVPIPANGVLRQEISVIE